MELQSEGGSDIFVARYGADGFLSLATRLGVENQDGGASVAALADWTTMVSLIENTLDLDTTGSMARVSP